MNATSPGSASGHFLTKPYRAEDLLAHIAFELAPEGHALTTSATNRRSLTKRGVSRRRDHAIATRGGTRAAPLKEEGERPGSVASQETTFRLR